VFTTVSILLAVLCLLPAAAKLSGLPQMRAAADHAGIPWPRYRLIGVAELAATVGVLIGLRWRPLGMAAAVGMVLLLVGAVITHRRVGDGGKELAPAVVVLLVTLTYLAVGATG